MMLKDESRCWRRIDISRAQQVIRIWFAYSKAYCEMFKFASNQLAATAHCYNRSYRTLYKHWRQFTVCTEVPKLNHSERVPFFGEVTPFDSANIFSKGIFLLHPKPGVQLVQTNASTFACKTILEQPVDYNWQLLIFLFAHLSVLTISEATTYSAAQKSETQDFKSNFIDKNVKTNEQTNEKVITSR